MQRTVGDRSKGETRAISAPPAECRVTGPEHSTGRKLAPASMTIFGAGGDLTRRLIVPALCHLVRAKELPDEFTVIGVDHNERTTEEWRRMLREAMRERKDDA